ncbi:MAG TPA: AraC family transcriptional regulator [Aggregicoccus sp.]|nr:AraC family transcriptional regulator [Aggregicoccus sp.]
MSSATLTPDFHDWRADAAVDAHVHEEGQLLVALEGAMEVRLGALRLRLSPREAVWVPPGLAHSARSVVPTAFRGVLVGRAASALLPSRPARLDARPLLLATVPELASPRAERRRLAAGLVLDELLSETGSLGSPALPAQARWAEPCRRALEDLGAPPTLEEAALLARQSRRTFSRAFRAATGLAWGQWVREARLARAAALLGGGMSVTDAALAVGYATPSAFTVAFQRGRGVAPVRLRGARQARGAHPPT